MTHATEPREVELRWRASSLTKAIATCAGVALAAAVLGPRWQLVAFAAPLLGVLCSISWQRPPATVYVQGRPGLTRCFENDETRLTVWVTTDAPTIANICQHTYFNLDGREDALGHDIMIAADQIVVVDERQVPTGELIVTG